MDPQIAKKFERLENRLTDHREKQLFDSIRLDQVEKEVHRTVGDVKDIKESISDIQKLMHRAFYIVVGAVFFSLMQEFGVLAVLKKIFL